MGCDIGKLYLWRVKDETNTIIRTGIVEHCVDVCVEDIVYCFNDLRDRALFEMQQFIDEYYSHMNWTFEYVERQVDYWDWSIVDKEKE